MYYDVFLQVSLHIRSGWRLTTRILPQQPDQQKLLLIQLAQQTGLTIRYAGQCLEGNGWDIQRAVANFAQVKVLFVIIELLCVHKLDVNIDRRCFYQDNLPTDAWLRR